MKYKHHQLPRRTEIKHVPSFKNWILGNLHLCASDDLTPTLTLHHITRDAHNSQPYMCLLSDSVDRYPGFEHVHGVTYECCGFLFLGFWKLRLPYGPVLVQQLCTQTERQKVCIHQDRESAKSPPAVILLLQVYAYTATARFDSATRTLVYHVTGGLGSTWLGGCMLSDALCRRPDALCRNVVWPKDTKTKDPWQRLSWI